MKRTDARNSFVGNGQLNALQVATMGLGDTLHPTLAIASDLAQRAGENPRKRVSKQTITVAPTGGTGSKLLVTLKRYCVDEKGAALADTTVVTIDGVDYTCGSGGIISHTLNGADYTTLHDLVAAINALPGFVAHVLHALSTHTTDSDNFIAASEQAVKDAQIGYTETLYRDVSEDVTAFLRIGIPRPFDRAPLQLVEIRGAVTGATAGTVQLIKDDDAAYQSGGGHQVEYNKFTLVATTLTQYLGDNVLDAATIHGPVVLKVYASDLSACSFAVKYRQALVQERC